MQQFVKFTISSTWHMHVHNLSTHDILKLFLTSTEKKLYLFWIEKLHYNLVLWFLNYVGNVASRKLKNGTYYFLNHNTLIWTLHLSQKYTIKRYCSQELQNYISYIMCSLFLQVCLLTFSTFYFGKLVFRLLVFIICFLFFMSF